MSKYGITGTNLFVVNDPELDEYKKTILTDILADIIAVTTKRGNNLVTYYVTKPEAIELFSNAENVYSPRKKGTNELRVSMSSIVSNGNSFKIIIPSISQKEYDEYLSISEDETNISKIFGPFAGKIRPDILNWIKNNKETFKEYVNTTL